MEGWHGGGSFRSGRRTGGGAAHKKAGPGGPRGVLAGANGGRRKTTAGRGARQRPLRPDRCRGRAGGVFASALGGNGNGLRRQLMVGGFCLLPSPCFGAFIDVLQAARPGLKKRARSASIVNPVSESLLVGAASKRRTQVRSTASLEAAATPGPVPGACRGVFGSALGGNGNGLRRQLMVGGFCLLFPSTPKLLLMFCRPQGRA